MQNKNMIFLKNAAILSLAGILSRILGAIYRIPLYRLINAEGIGLYSMGYNVYAILLAISATGIPVAISKLVAEEKSHNRMYEAKRVFNAALFLLTTIGFGVTILLIRTAPKIANVIGDTRAIYPLVAIAPAIFIVSILASIKGYFQGMEIMWPTAISQIIEQIFRIITVLTLAWYAISVKSSIEVTAAAATFGSVVGAFMGLIAMLIMLYINSKKNKKRVIQTKEGIKTPYIVLLKRIIKFSVPLTIGAMVIPLISGIDTILVPSRLVEIGYTSSQATSMFGLLNSVMPLINLPTMLAAALAASLVPAISSELARNNTKMIKTKSKMAIQLILLMGLPATAGLSILAKPITLLLYGTTQAAGILEVLAFSVGFLTLHQACSGILQGLGYTGIPVRNLLVGAIAKIFLNYILISIPGLNIIGAALSTVVAYVISSLLNIRSVLIITGFNFNWLNILIKPLLATLLMSIAVSYSYNSIKNIVSSNTLVTLISIALGMVTFFISVIFLKCFSKEDLSNIPIIGNKLTKILFY